MRALFLGFASLAITAVAAAQTADEVVTVDAFAVLTAEGSLLQVSSDSHVFAGTMSGPYFIDTGQGPIPAGSITCTGMLEADDNSGSQTADARCRLVASDGAVAFARFDCDGFRLVGCAGPFSITGGEGRLEGATGDGTITLRRYETALAVDERGNVHEAALGIASWKDLRVDLPQAQ